MKIPHLLLALALATLSGCSKQDQVEFTITYTPTDEMVPSYEHKVTVQRGKSFQIPSTYQTLGDNTVRSTVSYSESGELKILSECGQDRDFEEKVLMLDLDAFKEHEFTSGVTVRAVAHKNDS